MNLEPSPRYDSAAVKVRLLQDAVYAEDTELWTTLLRNRAHIEGYLHEIGLTVVVSDEDGFAYLRQVEGEENSGIPRLFRRGKLSYGVTLLGALLRERLLGFDEAVRDESRLILSKNEILEMAAPFFPVSTDQVKTTRALMAALSSAEELGILRLLAVVADGEERYEVRRIIKAKFPAETLKELLRLLQEHARVRTEL